MDAQISAVAFAASLRKSPVKRPVKTGLRLGVRPGKFGQLTRRTRKFSASNYGPRRPAAKTNQLIVGPAGWAYQVLGATIGERFMENREAAISIDRFFFAVIATRVIGGLLTACDHIFGHT